MDRLSRAFTCMDFRLELTDDLPPFGLSYIEITAMSEYNSTRTHLQTKQFSFNHL